MHTAKLPEITLHGATFSSVCWWVVLVVLLLLLLLLVVVVVVVVLFFFDSTTEAEWIQSHQKAIIPP